MFDVFGMFRSPRSLVFLMLLLCLLIHEQGQVFFTQLHSCYFWNGWGVSFTRRLLNVFSFVLLNTNELFHFVCRNMYFLHYYPITIFAEASWTWHNSWHGQPLLLVFGSRFPLKSLSPFKQGVHVSSNNSCFPNPFTFARYISWVFSSPP